jgi:hypothetical protein
MHAEHRSALGEIAESMGRPTPVQIGQSVTYNTQNITAIDERSIYNVAMQLIIHGAAQSGAAMAQNRMSQEAMMQSIMGYAASQQHKHVHFYNIGTPPNEPEPMQVTSSAPPPPPPPPPLGAGAIRRGRSDPVRERGRVAPWAAAAAGTAASTARSGA